MRFSSELDILGRIDIVKCSVGNRYGRQLACLFLETKWQKRVQVSRGRAQQRPWNGMRIWR